MCKSPEGKLAWFLLTQFQEDCWTVVGFLTGHNLLASHASWMVISNNDTCRKCREAGMTEVVEHLICLCQALSRTRFKYRGASVFKELDKVANYVACLLKVRKNRWCPVRRILHLKLIRTSICLFKRAVDLCMEWQPASITLLSKQNFYVDVSLLAINSYLVLK